MPCVEKIFTNRSYFQMRIFLILMERGFEFEHLQDDEMISKVLLCNSISKVYWKSRSGYVLMGFVILVEVVNGRCVTTGLSVSVFRTR